MADIPVGFKFDPTDEELVLHYLLNRLKGNPLPKNCIVKDFDVYGDREPWEIWDFLGGPSRNDHGFLYVFSPLKKKTPQSSRIQRKVGVKGGSWHGEDAAKPFRACGIKWTQRKFKYENNNCKSSNNSWLMQEYCLDQSLFKNQKNADVVVLCRIKKNDKKRKLNDENKDELYDVKNMVSAVDLKRLKIDHGFENMKADVEEKIGDCCSLAEEAITNDELIVSNMFTVDELLGDAADFFEAQSTSELKIDTGNESSSITATTDYEGEPTFQRLLAGEFDDTEAINWKFFS